MEGYRYLLDIALILISTKVLGLLTRAIRLPQVCGALLAGIILGPVGLNLIQSKELIHILAEIGVIVLMFESGLEVDIKELKKCQGSALLVAVLGVLVPLVVGFGISYLYLGTELFTTVSSHQFLQQIFLGVVLTATSVSITVEVLKEMGKLSTRAGNIILGAAIIDDILGIIGLTIVMAMASGGNINLFVILLKIFLFFIFAGVVGYFGHKVFAKWVDSKAKDLRRYVITSFAFCLFMAYVAEHYFGVSDITGAFIAGLVISNTSKSHYISKRFETSSYMLLSPMFFASIGLGLTVTAMDTTVFGFTVLLTIVAVITKVIGCGLGAKLTGTTNKEALQVGTGMISRGEVALIMASKGLPLGLIEQSALSPLIIMIMVTTIITPIALKFVFKDKEVINTNVVS